MYPSASGPNMSNLVSGKYFAASINNIMFLTGDKTPIKQILFFFFVVDLTLLNSFAIPLGK